MVLALASLQKTFSVFDVDVFYSFVYGFVTELYLSLTIARITFVLNTSYLKILGYDYQLLVQALLQVL